MEELRQTIVEKWPTILECALMVVSYFLIFLYRSKIKSTKLNITTLFKERTAYVDETDRALREALSNTMKRCDELEKRILRNEKALSIIINEEEANDEKRSETISDS